MISLLTMLGNMKNPDSTTRDIQWETFPSFVKGNVTHRTQERDSIKVCIIQNLQLLQKFMPTFEYVNIIEQGVTLQRKLKRFKHHFNLEPFYADGAIAKTSIATDDVDGLESISSNNSSESKNILTVAQVSRTCRI